jgi:uncharacterized protein YjiS (DUF1127 family)
MAAIYDSIFNAAPRSPSLRQQLALRLMLGRSRQALKTLDQSALNDIGLSKEDAAREAKRSFWDVPSSWRD